MKKPIIKTQQPQQDKKHKNFKPKKQEQVEQKSNHQIQQQYSSSSDEDQNGELVNDKLQSKFLTVIARLRNKDPKLYETKANLFDENDFQQEDRSANNRIKKYTYKDMERDTIMEQMKAKQQSKQQKSKSKDNTNTLTPFEQEQMLKNQFKKAAQKVEQENEDDDMFKVKQKQKKVKKNNKQQQALEQLLKQQTNPQDSQVLKKFWTNDAHLDQTDLFLKKYILSKGWIDKGVVKVNPDIDNEDQQRSVEIDEFEAKYNFRFEQPDGTQIQTFPRKIEESFRMTRQTRKQKRKRRQEQKKEQLKKQLAQIQKLKNMKKEQIVRKIGQINENANIDKMQIENQQIDNQQNQWFYCQDCQRGLNEEQIYYQCCECQDYTLCNDCFQLIIHSHHLDKKQVPYGCGAPSQQEVKRTLASLMKCKKCRCKIDDFKKYYEFKATKDGQVQYIYCQECYDMLTLNVKKKCTQVKQKKVNLNEMLQKDPQKVREYVQDQYVDRLIEEYVNLDFKDAVGDTIKTKFKYIDVKPESFGLSDQQILFSDDKQLNKYVSIKKLAPYYQQNIKLRNSIYNKKIKTINKSAKENKKTVTEGMSEKLRKKKMQTLRQKVQKRRQSANKNRVRLIDLSTKESQIKHFVPTSRLQSYGL